jgi:hypothetical protein
MVQTNKPQFACHGVKIDKMSVQFGLTRYFDIPLNIIIGIIQVRFYYDKSSGDFVF